MNPLLSWLRFYTLVVCEDRKRKGRRAFGSSFFPFPFLRGYVAEEKGERETFCCYLGWGLHPPAASLSFGYHSLPRVVGVSSLGPVGILPQALWLDCGNCTRLQVVEQLMGRSQGPAVTKGNSSHSS